MPKSKNEELSYSLLQVAISKENKHASTVFIHTTHGNIFSVYSNCYQSTGDLLLAEWGSDGKLGALNEVKEVTKDEVVLGRCIKSRGGYGILKKVELSLVEDLR